MAIEAINRFSPQPLIPDNRPGGGGTLASSYVARAAPDGYTMMFATFSALVLQRYFHPDLPFTPDQAFAPIGMVSETAYTLAVHQSIPGNTLAEILDYVRQHPDDVTYASTGIGSSPHVLGQRLCDLSGVKMLHVPYQQAPNMVTDLMVGRVHMTFETLVNALAMTERGTMRVVAVTSPERMALAPAAETMLEAGFPGLSTMMWTALVVPAATPASVQDWLAEVLARALRAPETAASFANYGVRPRPMPPAEVRALLEGEDRKWRDVAQRISQAAG
ncbi:Bug family tripartite tricarboxylate transporter substrate binding protein [Roseomonas sp. BN140053]|uniref:Bug family tripartite tricarboxylate transporter substrate binding protein n=1 Tax=Roseomonas sp. BN140053 TaxID=3391898 RepID=UPI0039EB0149